MSLSGEALGFTAVCFSCDELTRRDQLEQHRFVWAAPDAPSPGSPRAGRPTTVTEQRGSSSITGMIMTTSAKWGMHVYYAKYSIT